MISAVSRDRKIVDRINHFTPREIDLNLSGLHQGETNAIKERKNQNAHQANNDGQVYSPQEIVEGGITTRQKMSKTFTHGF